jgi:SAM-dependent methyltransferase
MATYAIRGGVEGKRRLDLLAQTMAGTTHALLAEVSLHQGSSCIDLGCGAGHVSRHLGKLVGPTGRVLGIDFDAVKLAAAREECERDGLANVEFRTADVANWDEPETYDLVFGRFVVSHLSDRPGMVRRMCAALRPGGRLVLEDIDYGGAFCYPPNVAFGLQCTLYCSLISRRGGEALLGPQLVGLCRDAGLDEIQMRVVQPVHTGRHPGKAMSLCTLENIADAAIAEGLATRAELGEAIRQLAEFTDDPHSIIACPRVFQVWGRRPARPASLASQ